MPPLASRLRYREDRVAAFNSLIQPVLHPGATILDIGPGRRPSVPPAQRPPDCTYVGLDVSRDELDQAPDGSYDEVIVTDVAEFQPELCARFDLIVSWWAVEHLADVSAAFRNFRLYLKPSGRLVAEFSGRYSVHSVVNRVLPLSVTKWAMKRLLGREPDTVFRAYYDACTYSGLTTLLREWPTAQILPRYTAGSYFHFSQTLMEVYLKYEDWITQRPCRNLASHYTICAIAD